MIAEDYLNRIKRGVALVERMRDEKARIESMVYSVTQDLTPRESCRTPLVKGDKTADSIVELVRVKEELDETVHQYALERQLALRRVMELERTAHVDVLYKRYFEVKGWEEIAVEMGYTYHHVHKLHSDALVKFQDILDNE